MFRLVRHIVTLTTLAALVAPSVLPAKALARTVTIEECRDLADEDVRAKIRSITEDALKEELAQIDYRALVDARWREVRLDGRIDASINRAIEAVRADTTWLERVYSNVSPETAQRIATAVAEKTYGSDEFKAALRELSASVGNDIGKRVERSAGRLSSPVITCVQSALSNRYGGAIAGAFATETERSVGTTGAGRVQIGATDLAIQGGATISGLILVVTRRVIARMVTSMSTRIAGAIATRIVSLFAAGAGLALIAYDIYRAGDGVFPIIAERMKSDEAKDLIKQEIVKGLSTEVSGELSAIGSETADTIYKLWLDFRQKYNALLALGDRSPAFAAFLKERTIDQLQPLGRIVGIVTASEGEERLLRRLEDGSLARALVELDEPGLAIAADTNSLDEALAWRRLAGGGIGKVAEFGLHTLLKPSDLNLQQLTKLLGLGERGAAVRVAGLNADARNLLLDLPADQLKSIAARFSAPELAAFADYQKRLTPPAARRMSEAVGQKPSVMQALAKDGVRNGIVRSEDQLAALDMLLRPAGPVPDFERFYLDFQSVTEGRVDYRIFWERYTALIIVSLVLGLIVLLMLKRLLFGPRR